MPSEFRRLTGSFDHVRRNSLGGLGFAMEGRVSFVTAESKSSERGKSRGRRINYQMLNLI